MKTHKLLSIVLSVLLLASACQAEGKTPAPKEQVKFAAMKGATAMGITKYVDELSETEDSPVSYEILTMPDQVATNLLKGDLDVALIPANLAATLYNKSEGKIQVAALNVLNVLHFAANGVELNSLEDLKGQTIYATGKGATPDAILQNLLAKAGLTIGEDVEVEFRSEATEVASILQQEGTIAFIPEPFLSAVKLQNKAVETKLNTAELWQNNVANAPKIVTGVLVARKDFLEDNDAWFKTFLDECADSAIWVNQNPKDAGLLIEEQGIIAAPVAEAAIPNAGITMVRELDMKDTLQPYLQVLHSTNPALVGGELPAEDFYYLGD